MKHIIYCSDSYFTMPKTKRKAPQREQPRYVQPVSRDSRAEWLRRRHCTWTVSHCWLGCLPTRYDKVAVYSDLDISREGKVTSRMLTQGACLMLLCNITEITPAAYDRLHERDKVRCLWDREVGSFYFVERNPHGRMVGGGMLYWLYPGSLTSSAQDMDALLEQASETDASQDGSDDGARLCRANGEFCIVQDADARRIEEFVRNELNAEVNGKVWYRTWRDIQDGAELTYECELPNLEESSSEAEIDATPEESEPVDQTEEGSSVPAAPVEVAPVAAAPTGEVFDAARAHADTQRQMEALLGIVAQLSERLAAQAAQVPVAVAPVAAVGTTAAAEEPTEDAALAAEEAAPLQL